MREIYFETYGCSANYNSTEIMEGLVKQAGFNITTDPDYADIVVVNSCIVKEPTEEKIRRRIADLLKKGKKVILAGCMSKICQKKFTKKNLFLLDTHQIKNITNLIKDIRDGTYSAEKYLEERNEVKVNLPKISKEKLIGINQISEGCLGECSYCITRIAKGKLFSFPMEKIIGSIKNDLSSGCKEIWLTSQDNASYGNDEGKNNLVELLKEIVELKGNFYVRIGMMNPDNVLKILPELIEVYKNKKIYKFLHLPLQSANDRVLKKMKRKYSKKNFVKIVEEFRKEFPDMHFSTDVIVGFPRETESEFNETYELVKKLKPETINISKFWPRPNTSAATFPDAVESEIKIERASKIAKLHKEICNSNQKNFLGEEIVILVDQKGFGNTYLARDENYKLIAVISKNKILGRKMKVRIKSVTPHYLISEEIKDN